MAVGPLRAAASFVLAAAAVSPAWVPACQTRDVFLVPHSDGTGGAGGAAHGSAGAGRGGTSQPDSGNMPGAHADAGEPEADAGDDHDAGTVTCETQERSQQVPQPVGVYILVDQSNAMLMQWSAVSTALQEFILQSSELGGVSIGIQYYAITPGAEPYANTVCKWESYESPDVTIATLPLNRDPLFTSISNHGPFALIQLLTKIGQVLTFQTESPIDAAIQGGVQGARDWVALNPMTAPAAAVLLVTNGIVDPAMSPNCMTTREKAMAAAATGIAREPNVPTYVLDVGDPNPDLDAIAQAGGTGKAYLATPQPVGSTTPTQLPDVLSALTSIRQQVLPCDVTVSVTEQELTQNRLNVELSTPGTPPSRYGRVKSVTGCSSSTNPGEWYVEGNGAAARVRLCPSTCEAARTVKDAQLDVVHGCRTTLIE